MTASPTQLVERNRSRGILVDTNLLLLFVIGTYDRSRIAMFKRTQSFLPEDFDLLGSLLRNFSRIATTPNVLTEVSNLTTQLPGALSKEALGVLASTIEVLHEQYIPSGRAAANERFSRFGLTDTTILELLSLNRMLVLTDDFSLSQFIEWAGFDALNFNHIRVLGWNLH